jgi:hypothetical protein
MVKIVKTAALGPEIITLKDLTGAKAAASPQSSLQAAASAVESMDKWIGLADRGITMLGRVDSIFGRIQTFQRPGGPPDSERVQQMEQRMIRLPAGESRINSDLVQQPGLQDPPAAAAVRGQAPPVDIAQVIGALDMIAKLQPGLTVQELSDSMKVRPDECQRILSVAMGENIPKVQQ